MAEENKTGEDNPYKVPEAALSSTDVYAPEGKLYTQAMIEHLKNTKPWVRFIAVLGFVLAGFMLLGGISVLVFGSRIDTVASATMMGLGVGYLLFGCIYLTPLVFLNRYASSINELLLSGETRALENALRHQKSFWKFMGIAAIIGLAFIAVAIIVGVLVTVFTLVNR